jgi:hypothetical protein
VNRDAEFLPDAGGQSDAQALPQSRSATWWATRRNEQQALKVLAGSDPRFVALVKKMGLVK